MDFWREPTPIANLRRALAAAGDRLERHGWEPVGRKGSGRLVRALRRELPATSALQTIGVAAVARARGQDDVAFALADGRLAVVHLSFAPRAEGNSASLGFVPDAEHFLADLAIESTHVAALLRGETLAAAMGPGRAVCAGCGADWGLDQHGAGCAICQGWALARPCPRCDGRCEQVWQRAVTDSNDQREAVWIGTCALADWPPTGAGRS